MRAAEPFAVYVHVPYCRHVCPYCDFNVLAVATPPERAYVEALAAELAAYGVDAHWAGRPLGSVYFGGERINAVICVLAAIDLARSLPWFAASVRDIRMLRIEEFNDLMPAVQQAAEAP